MNTEKGARTKAAMAFSCHSHTHTHTQTNYLRGDNIVDSEPLNYLPVPQKKNVGVAREKVMLFSKGHVDVRASERDKNLMQINRRRKQEKSVYRCDRR